MSGGPRRRFLRSPSVTPAGLGLPLPRRQARRRPRSHGLVLMVALVAAVACSAPVDSGPKTIRPASIPLALRAETSTTTSTTLPTGESEEVTVYFFTKEEPKRLQAVKRLVSAPVTVEKVLQKLFTGPTPAEAVGLGLRTAINGETTILGARVENRILTVDTSKNFAFGTNPEQIIAYAQVVFTALDLEGVTGVQFAHNGRRIPVQAGDGSSQSQPLGRASFSELIPR